MKRGPGKRGTHSRPSIRFCDTLASKALNAELYADSSERTGCVYIIAEAGDKCVIGSWVFAKSPFDVGSHARNPMFLSSSSQPFILGWHNYGQDSRNVDAQGHCNCCG